MIVSDLAVPPEDRSDHRLAVDRVFQGEPEVVVIERRRVAAYRETVERRPRDAENLDLGLLLQLYHGFRIGPAHQVDRSTLEGANPGRDIVDCDGLNGVDEAAVVPPVVRVALGASLHTRLEGLQDEGACAD